MKFININTINSNLENNTIDFINQCEQHYIDQLVNTANSIVESLEDKPIVLISGPSGSGKTTSALKLSKILLDDFDCPSSVISLDNYFKSNDSPDMPKNGDGSIDLESPLCIDMQTLQDNIYSISQGKSFDMPYFNFTNQVRGGYRPFKVNKGEIVIFEGIHALNPIVTGATDNTTKIYVSVRTRLVNDDGAVLHPKCIRLMRRLMRDSLFRGRNYVDIFSYFNSVSVGEQKYITPFKPLANFDIDTFHSYEPSIYKRYLLNDLLSIQNDMKSNIEYNEIVSFLSEVIETTSDLVPNTSIVREFIGGSKFEY